jgi:alkylated DNA repair dioxygenase AlkB
VSRVIEGADGARSRYVQAMAGRQLGLLDVDANEPAFDREFRGIKRIPLAHGAWLDYAQGWLSGHAALFESLLRDSDWQTSEQHMYDRTVATPRLIAALPAERVPPLLVSAQQTLSARYGQELARVSLALYRDGRDSVAFHGDRIARELPSALVATLSVGAPRRFVLRPHARMQQEHGPQKSLALNLGWGDLLVMGGTCQRTWQHSIPKVSHAQPRIAIMFRPVWEPV